ncbi:hypothetical protein [Nocardia acidivorans]|uniref:hypothetical protein n=1 Tax=Nocardia acidivorans TaxID=404580 RepID=UPI000A7C744C|nr:hypothetical protein [Nocardia acidivorans]
MVVIEYDGQRIPAGSLFRDNRASNIRTLRVDGPASQDHVQLTVIRQEYEGKVSEPMRITVMTVERLLSKAFVPVGIAAGR